MQDVTGQVALITGSTSGMGLAIAQRYAAEGVTVVLNSRTPPAEPIELPGMEATPLYLQGDVSDEAVVSDMIRQVGERYGRLDILVNNAGTTVFVDHDDLGGVTNDDWQRILGVNVIGAWNTVKAAEDLLRASALGVVINITSIAGLRPVGSSIPYAVSKAGLNHLTTLLAKALGPDIRVNGIAPGFIETPWSKDYTSRREQTERDAPLRRAGMPDDIAEVALAILRADYLTGQIIAVDGGLTLV